MQLLHIRSIRMKLGLLRAYCVHLRGTKILPLLYDAVGMTAYAGGGESYAEPVRHLYGCGICGNWRRCDPDYCNIAGMGVADASWRSIDCWRPDLAMVLKCIYIAQQMQVLQRIHTLKSGLP